MKQCDLTKGLVFFLTIIITLCCGLIPSSWGGDDDIECSNRILKGYYSFSEKGKMEVLDSKGKAQVVSYGSIGFFYANVDGDIYGEETLQIGPDIIQAVFNGSYVINENCMGTVSITASTLLGDIDIEISVVSGPDGKVVHMLNTSVEGMTPLGIVGQARKHTAD